MEPKTRLTGGRSLKTVDALWDNRVKGGLDRAFLQYSICFRMLPGIEVKTELIAAQMTAAFR